MTNWRQHSGVRGALLLGVVLLSSARLPAAAAPIPANKDYRAQRQVFDQRETLDAFDRLGGLDGRWGVRGREFIDQVITHYRHAADASPAGEIEHLGRQLIIDGCEEPLVLSCYGRVLADFTRTEPALKHLRKALPGLEAYPLSHRFQAAHLIAHLTRTDQKEGPRNLERAAQLLQQLLESAVYPQDEQKFLLDDVRACVDEMPLERLGTLLEALEQNGKAQPWTRATLAGIAHTRKAWAARGGGWASTVTADGWRTFGAELDLARRDLTKAWELDPKAPHPAQRMIAVVMGAGDDPRREMRLWFDRAIAACLDYRSAYNSMYWGLLPRWHGRYEDIYALGVEALQTQRFDTDAPWELVQALLYIRQYQDGSTEFWQRPGGYENLQRMFAGYAQAEPEKAVSHRRTVQAYFAWKTAHWADARALVDQLQNHLAATGLSAVNANALEGEEMLGEILANTGPDGDEVQRGTALARGGQLPEALALYEKLAGVKRDVPAVAHLLQTRRQSLRWRTDFDAGKPVRLIFDPDLPLWHAAQGQWVIESEHAILANTTTHGLRLICQTRFGPCWELTGTVETLINPFTIGQPGVFLADGGAPRIPVFLFDPVKKAALVGNLNYRDELTASAPVQPKVNRFRIRMNDGVVDAWLNDQRVFTGAEIPDYPGDPAARLGIGGYYWFNAVALRFQDLVLRRLDPAGPASERRGPPPAPRW